MGILPAILSRTAVLVAGAIAGAAVAARRIQPTEDLDSLNRAVRALQATVAKQEIAQAERFRELEKRVELNESKLNEFPSFSQMLTAAEEMVANRFEALEHRLSYQLQSIEVLKTTTSHTEELIQKLLESVESLRQRELEAKESSAETETSRADSGSYLS